MARAPRTLLEIATRRVGLYKATKALAVMVQWQVAREDLGHEPTTQEYRDWWKVSTATAYRDLARFREAFPSEQTPGRLLDATAASWASRPGRRSVGSLGAAPVPVLA